MPRNRSFEKQSQFARRRIALTLSQTLVAALSQLSIHSYRAIEQGLRQPTRNEAARISTVLELFEDAYDAAVRNTLRIRRAQDKPGQTVSATPEAASEAREAAAS